MTRDAKACVNPDDPQSDESLDELIHNLNGMPGLNFAAYDEAFLRKSILSRVLAGGHMTVAGYAGYLAENRAEAEDFQRSLCIGYSEFFRNPLTFGLLEQRLLPSLVAMQQLTGQGEIRVWSAGCATGQEAWSVAILLDELTHTGNPPHAYRIFASDLSEPQLAQARAGAYRTEAVGNVRSRHLREYFIQQGESYVIAPRLKERVDFSTYDLLDQGSSSPQASIYGDFDLILCCNLLFYYRAAIRRRILDKLCGVLAPGGYFVTGETERDSVAASEGLRVVPASAVFQKPA